MNFIDILFYVFAGITLLGASGILLAKNILYAAFSLVLSFLGVAALYVIASADFIAIVQIMIYIGGVLVLMIFGIMLTSKSKVSDNYLTSQTYNRFTGFLAGAGLFTIFILAIVQANFGSIGWISKANQAQQTVSQSSVSGIGVALMTDVVLPFEVSGILLLVALIGAAYIAGRKT
jgi:NADH-quinone oxidoreductase subunit J